MWSYQDEILQSTQLLWGKSVFVPGIDTKISAVVSVEENSVSVFDGWNEQIYYSSPVSDFIILSNNQAKRYTENWWEDSSRLRSPLVSLKDMSRKPIELEDFFGENSYSFSPDGKYFIYFNPHERSY